MKRIAHATTIALTVAVGLSAYSDIAGAASKAHTHIGHVISGWKDTPEGKGFLPTAQAEAAIAAKHAGFAASSPDDLKAMKVHAGHVRHVIDPTTEASGPGLGYGLLKATNGAIKHITFASESDDASDHVKKHAFHMMTSASNAVTRTQLAMAEADAIIASSTAADAATHVTKLVELTTAIITGHDANGDGKISWKKDEGGLDVADKHMGFMIDGEGLTR